MQREAPADREHRPAIIELDRGVPRAARLPTRRRGRRPNGCAACACCGGLAEQLRFFHTRRPRDHAASARSRAGGQVRRRGCAWSSIEPLGLELPMYDITTGTGDFIANGVVSHNCFARPDARVPGPRRGAGLRARDRRQGQRARGAAGGAGAAVVEAASTSRWARTPTRTSGSRAATSSCAASGRRCATPRNPCSILTKSPLLLRDLDLLQEIARGRRRSARACRCRRWTRRRGGRPSRTRRTRARGWRRSRSSTAPASRPAS